MGEGEKVLEPQIPSLLPLRPLLLKHIRAGRVARTRRGIYRLVHLPAGEHLTLPGTWRIRRFRVPTGVVLHHADLPPEERAWFGAVPTTNPRRSPNDCAREDMSPDLLRQAAQQAIRRGLVTAAEQGDVEEALKPFGGLSP